ncbi:unnamed protein product [Menidia menidia]|uniref:(Atlantic silverside) hypothetical protein n=1 Tax=Menidia menidia TaxID=238744 RepID=A0A8S4BV31_9TELE|nr:unnamed protein product [Menidia menidia]
METEPGGVASGVVWSPGTGQAFSQGGLLLTNNSVRVPRSGLYFVYSQASFRVSCNHGDQMATGATATATPLSHSVWRLSDSLGGKRVPLMGAVRSACGGGGAQEEGVAHGNGGHGGNGGAWFHAIYLGAVFQLNRGDLLQTETNQLQELETEEGRTFFGAFAL